MQRLLIEPLERRLLWAASLVRDITPGTGSHSYENMVGIGSTLYFSVDDGSRGKELWSSNQLGDTLPIEVRPGSNGSNPSKVYEAAGEVWFTASNGTSNGNILWRLDGQTPVPTDGRGAGAITAHQGYVYFGGLHKDFINSIGYELYRMKPDGTNVELVKDIWPGAFSGYPFFMASTGDAITDRLVIAATSETLGTELFVSNGKPELPSADPAGTKVLLDLEHGPGSSNPLPSNQSNQFVVAGNWLYATMQTQAEGRELVAVSVSSLAKPDEVESHVFDLNPGPGNSSPFDLTAWYGRMVFTTISSPGYKLWVAEVDEETGELSVNEVSPLSALYPTVVGGTVYFVSGNGLYKSDGTSDGTHLVKAGIYPGRLATAGGLVYFSGSDAQRGNELWQSDGTEAGTVRVSDINPGIYSADPANLTDVGGTLYFTATNPTYGTELWKYTPDVVSPPTVASMTVGDGTSQRSQVKKLTVAFDRVVTLQAGAFKLVRLNTGGSGANDNSAPTDASGVLGAPTSPDGGKTWVLTFAGTGPFMQMNGATPTGSLVDGVYRLSVDPSKVSANGVTMTATNAALTFHRLFGDANGSKNVNTADFGAFRNAFGKNADQAGFDAAFDFDNNGTVNTLDFGLFRGHYGKSFTY